MNPRGTLEKLTILAFKDPDCGGTEISRFEAFVNPGELTLSQEIEYDAVSAPGTTDSRMDFKKIGPTQMTLTFFLDGTGANGRPENGTKKVEESKPGYVQQMVERFQAVTGYNGDIHRPNYLKVLWGTLPVKHWVLKSASIAYKLFKPDGAPLRAVITASFNGYADDKTRVAKAQDHSADLTHRRTVKAGDNLPMLCNEIYGDPRRYLQVAQANGLDDFRNIAPGTVVFFPPLEK